MKKSSKNAKKYDAVIDGKKTVSFGATGYSDFTKHKDEDRKKNYIARHNPNQDWKTIQLPVSGPKIFSGISLPLKLP